MGKIHSGVFFNCFWEGRLVEIVRCFLIYVMIRGVPWHGVTVFIDLLTFEIVLVATMRQNYLNLWQFSFRFAFVLRNPGTLLSLGVTWFWLAWNMTLFNDLLSGERWLRFVELKIEVELFLLLSQPTHSIVIPIELLLNPWVFIIFLIHRPEILPQAASWSLVFVFLEKATTHFAVIRRVWRQRRSVELGIGGALLSGMRFSGSEVQLKWSFFRVGIGLLVVTNIRTFL